MHGPQNVKFLIHGFLHFACLHVVTLNLFYSSGASFVLKKESDGLLKLKSHRHI